MEVASSFAPWVPSDAAWDSSDREQVDGGGGGGVGGGMHRRRERSEVGVRKAELEQQRMQNRSRTKHEEISHSPPRFRTQIGGLGF